jgi:hypothetical protein
MWKWLFAAHWYATIIGSCYSCRRTALWKEITLDLCMKRRHFKAFSLASAQSCIKKAVICITRKFSEFVS